MESARAIVLARDCRGPEPWPSLGLTARQLAPVANKPILFHHLEALARAGVHRAALVTDAGTDTSIRAAVGDGSRWGLEVAYAQSDCRDDVLAPAGVAAFGGGVPVLVQHGDVLLRERLETLCEQFAERALDALVLHPGGRPDGALGRRLAPSGYILGAEVQRALRREAAPDATCLLDDLLARLGASGARIEIREIEACLPCRGRAEGLLEANRWMLEDLTPDHPGDRVHDSEIQGRVALHPSAEVRDSLIRGPVSIAAGVSISNAYIGPYTSIGAGVRIDGVEIEHSIVLGGAQIGFVGVRLQDSIIGARAHIDRDFRLPQAMSLAIGESAAVSLG